MKRHGVIVEPEGELGATFNPAAVKHEDGRYIMLVRSLPKGDGYEIYGKGYASHLSLWEGDSVDNFKLTDDKAITRDNPIDKFGCEDPRISKIDDTYYITYAALSRDLGTPKGDKGLRIALASTKDFKNFTKHGVIGPGKDRDCKAGALFKSKGKIHFMWKDGESGERMMIVPAPKDFTNPDEWSKIWENHDFDKSVMIAPQDNSYEDRGIEPGPPPIETEEGLLSVYSSISTDHVWSVSAVLLDKNDPKKILKKTETPILEPEMDYEKKGDVNKVCFPCGAIIENNRLHVYYGGADKVCAVASESMDKIKNDLKPFKDNPVDMDERALRVRKYLAKKEIEDRKKKQAETNVIDAAKIKAKTR